MLTPPVASVRSSSHPGGQELTCSAEDLSSLADEEVGRRLTAAQKELLEARAGYQLRNCIVENVLHADPLLKAVHTGANAAPMERCAPSPPLPIRLCGV